MSPERIVVFLPCHALDDFPTWLDDREAGDLLSAWTAAWHPALIAAVGSAPGWASVETPPSDAATLLGIVPANCDERFAALLDVAGLAGSHFVRQAQGRDATVAAAIDAVVEAGLPAARGALLVADFYALGLAWLLAELLARRMRSSTGIVGDDFSVAVVAAAQAAVAGDEAAARDKLRECFGALEATRSQYYAVDVWLLDLVLLAESTLGERLADELNAPTPLGLLATGELLERLGRDNPALLERLRARIAEGTCEVVGGRDDDSAVDSHLLEALGASLDRGAAIQQRLLGAAPVTFGQTRGGSSAYLPQLLHDRGYRGAIWNLFDGTPLPDPGSSRIRWHGPDGSAIEAVARSPLDARAAGTFLQLAEKVGDAMDHDHSCILAFAHHAGTACPWFHDLRRIAAWTTLLGRFVTPATLFAETENAGTRADFAADAFPPGLPGTSGASPADEIDGRVSTAAAEAAEWAAGVPAVAECVPAPTAPAPVRQGRPGLWRGVFGARAADEDRLVLENGSLRLAVHPRSGGVLSLRVPGGRANRLSQALAVRSTRPPPPVGAAWESVEERSEYSRMVADQITRQSDSEIVSRGRLVAATGSAVGAFTQRVALVAGLPLVRLDIDVEVQGDLAGPLFEAYVASRFAWNENEDIDLRRSLHGESIVTERTRFTAPHFIEIVPAGERAAKERVLIATGGLPWHVRCTPHVVDTILTAAGARRASRRLLLGLGIEAPRSVALALLREPESAARAAVEQAP